MLQNLQLAMLQKQQQNTVNTLKIIITVTRINELQVAYIDIA